MTMNKQARKLRKTLERQRDETVRSALTLADRAGEPAIGNEIRFGLLQARETNELLALLPEPKIEVREPDLYGKGSPDSFFRDLAVVAGVPSARGDNLHAARERLQRHQQREDARRLGESRRRESMLNGRGIQVRRAEDGAQQRALATTSPTTGGSFIPPVWLTTEFASVSRAAAPLRELLPTMDLPDKTMELVIPRFDAVAGIIPMSAENTDPSDVYDDPSPSTDEVTAQVATFAAYAPVSQQVIDRSDLDAVIMRDLAEAYAAALQSQLISGTGTNGQILGFLHVPGTETVTWTSTAPTPTGLVTQIGATAAAVSNARLRPPSFALMRPARYFWLASQPDGSNNTPMERVGTGLVCDGDSGPVGPIAGLPIVLDGTIPSDVNTNQDVILAVRAADQLLLEDTPKFTVSTDVSGQASALTATITMHTYAAAFLNRYPASIGLLTGTGLTIAAGW